VDICGYMWIHVDTCGYMWIHVDVRLSYVDTLCGYMWFLWMQAIDLDSMYHLCL